MTEDARRHNQRPHSPARTLTPIAATALVTAAAGATGNATIGPDRTAVLGGVLAAIVMAVASTADYLVQQHAEDVAAHNAGLAAVLGVDDQAA